MTISIAIPAKNEERYIAGCIESVQAVADEVLVVLDPQGDDRTAELALALGARVEQVAFVSFAHLRNRTLELCRHPWVFFLDADERATPELNEELAALAQRTPEPEDPQAVVGYWIPRHNYFFGKRVGHAGWYPDHQLRLLWRERAHYPEEQRVHEVAELRGQTERLAGHMVHYNVDAVREFQAKQRRYARLEAERLHAQGERARPRHLLTQPLKEFWRRYVNWTGWRDGLVGLYLCSAMGYYKFWTYWHMLRLQRAG